MEKMERIETIGSESSGNMVLESKSYTVMSLSDELSSIPDKSNMRAQCCNACEGYITAPCSC